MTRVGFIGADPLGTRRAGPGIRAIELAGAVAAGGCDVCLASTAADSYTDDRFDVVVGASAAELHDLERRADVLVLGGAVLDRHLWLAGTGKAVVADLYIPTHLEHLEANQHLSLRQQAWRSSAAVRSVQRYLMRGDYFVCASERQRDFWMGHLAALGRLNPYLYRGGQAPSSIIGVVPFGLPRAVPQSSGPVLRGIRIGTMDPVVLWWGGLYPWFDVKLLLAAIGRVREQLPDVKLVLPVGRHPNIDIPEFASVPEARAQVAAHGLDANVVFLDEWIPYERRADLLLEADVGVSVAREHLETRYAFRTRMLDYLWAGLPVVCTDGDVLSDLVRDKEVGLVSPPGDLDGLAGNLHRMLDDRQLRATCSANAHAAAPDYTWDRVAEPLVAFCLKPRAAGDRRAGRRIHRSLLPDRRPILWRLQYDVHAFGQALGAGGYRPALVKTRDRLRRLVGRVARGRPSS